MNHAVSPVNRVQEITLALCLALLSLPIAAFAAPNHYVLDGPPWPISTANKARTSTLKSDLSTALRVVPAGACGPTLSLTSAAVVPLFGEQSVTSRAAVRVKAGSAPPRIDVLGEWVGWGGQESNGRPVKEQDTAFRNIIRLGPGIHDRLSSNITPCDSLSITVGSAGWTRSSPSESPRPAWWLAQYDLTGILQGWYRQDVDVAAGEGRGGITDSVGDHRETFVVGWADHDPRWPLEMPASFRCVSNATTGGGPCPASMVEVHPLPALCATCDGSAESVVGRVGALSVAAPDTTIIVGWSRNPSTVGTVAGTLPVFWRATDTDRENSWSVGVLPLPPGFDSGVATTIASIGQVTTDSVRVGGWVTNAGDSAAAVWSTLDGGHNWTVETLAPVPGWQYSQVLDLIGPPVNCRVPPCPQSPPPPIVGGSYSSSGAGVATLWEVDQATGALTAYDLNFLIDDLPPGLVLRGADKILVYEPYLQSQTQYIAGWGTQPSLTGDVDSVAWVIKTNPNSAGVGEKPFQALALRAAPNPMRTEVAISYVLPAAVPVRLTVHDITGRKVMTLVDAVQTVGEHRQVWRSTGAARGRLPSGVYMVRLAYGDMVKTTKVVLEQ